MDPAFARFTDTAKSVGPRAAVVLGSGLAGVTADFREAADVPFGAVPGFVPPTVHGHKGRAAVGHWGGVPAVVFFGRMHFYEGHPWDVVTRPVRLAAELGANAIVLTNAAGGVHPSLTPGSLMAISGHLLLAGPDAWKSAAPARPYSARLLAAMQCHETAAGRELLAGVYAALTGPCYETPAEIRAARAMGADAVGMSTAKEAEAAAGLGMEVAAVSCVTNQAAGMTADPLDHNEVLDNARLAVERLGRLLGHVLRAAAGPG